jgi:DNA primase
MIDTHELLQRIDLRALAEEAGARFRKDSSACPLHQGNNPSAFHLYRGEDGVWRWHCFTGCQTGGDAITFYQRWQGCDFLTGVRDLAARAGKVAPTPPVPVRAAPTAPSVTWQDRGLDFLRYTQDRLWENDPVLSYLRRERGLAEDTLHTWGLGWNPQDLWDDERKYGLHANKRLWLPRGIVIPGWRSDGLWYVKVRRPLGDEVAAYGLAAGTPPVFPSMKYAGVRGGVQTLFGEPHLQSRATLVVVEGEFDAMLLWQIAGDLVDVVTLGGASTRLSSDDLFLLASYPRIVAAHDNDAAGAHARRQLVEMSSRVDARPPTAKDVTAMWRAEGEAAVRGWIREALAVPPVAVAPGASSRG